MIWIFGDSFAGAFCKIGKTRSKEEFPDPEYTWQYMLSEQYEQKFKLRGLGGGSNFDTFKVITNNLHHIKSGDIVVVILSSPQRFLEVTEKKYSFNVLHSYYSHVLYNIPPPEGVPIVTSHLANNTKNENTEVYRYIVDTNYAQGPDVRDAWVYWTLDYWQSFVNYFHSIDVKCIGSGIGAYSGDIHYQEWAKLHESYSCDCNHFTRIGHKWNFVVLRWALENNLTFIDLKYVLDNAPEDIQPSLKK